MREVRGGHEKSCCGGEAGSGILRFKVTENPSPAHLPTLSDPQAGRAWGCLQLEGPSQAQTLAALSKRQRAQACPDTSLKSAGLLREDFRPESALVKKHVGFGGRRVGHFPKCRFPVETVFKSVAGTSHTFLVPRLVKCSRFSRLPRWAPCPRGRWRCLGGSGHGWGLGGPPVLCSITHSTRMFSLTSHFAHNSVFSKKRIKAYDALIVNTMVMRLH